jgi:hypothetical protein
MMAMGECGAFEPLSMFNVPPATLHRASIAAGSQYGVALVSVQANHSMRF